jgi:hypothetical protein
MFINIFGYETSHMHQELYVQTIFSPLLYHLAMMLFLPLYVFEWLCFTLNHVSQCKRNSHAQVISSCCNRHVRTILQNKEILQLTSFCRVTSSQLNICNECGQCTHSPQTSQRTVQSTPSRMSHLQRTSMP